MNKAPAREMRGVVVLLAMALSATAAQADLPSDIKENLDTEFDGILSVIRTFRNDSGHPSGKILEREQTYVLLQMFIPYCKKLYQLIEFFQ